MSCARAAHLVANSNCLHKRSSMDSLPYLPTKPAFYSASSHFFPYSPAYLLDIAFHVPSLNRHFTACLLSIAFIPFMSLLANWTLSPYSVCLLNAPAPLIIFLALPLYPTCTFHIPTLLPAYCSPPLYMSPLCINFHGCLLDIFFIPCMSPLYTFYPACLLEEMPSVK